MTKSSGTGGQLSIPSTPSALLIFLIADVRGYTHFTAEHGDEEAARLATRFAEIAEGVIGEFSGKVIELRGDEALCVLPSARNALRAALALQRAFARSVADDSSLPLQVGMGLDAGEAIPVKGGYRGGALNLAARLCSLAGPGEIFCSETVIGLARTTEGISFVDRGEVTLKGLPAPVRVIQVAPEGELPTQLPHLQPSLVTHPTNLPDEPTPFIGREREIDSVVQLLQAPAVRLVTLTGPGGTGKTRLALQVGSFLLNDYRDGVFLVSLATLNDSRLVPSAIAGTLGLKEVGDAPLGALISDYLHDKRLLLLLDNFEHVLDASSLVSSLLDVCREVDVLATSRIPLRLGREHEYAVPPLAVPDLTHLPNLEALSQYESVALFIERARAVRLEFQITDENAPAVAEICNHLDGCKRRLRSGSPALPMTAPGGMLGSTSPPKDAHHDCHPSPRSRLPPPRVFECHRRHRQAHADGEGCAGSLPTLRHCVPPSPQPLQPYPRRSSLEWGAGQAASHHPAVQV